MLKIKPALFASANGIKKQTSTKTQNGVQKQLRKTPKSKLDLSGEEDGYFTLNGKIINIKFPR